MSKRMRAWLQVDYQLQIILASLKNKTSSSGRIFSQFGFRPELLILLDEYSYQSLCLEELLWNTMTTKTRGTKFSI